MKTTQHTRARWEVAAKWWIAVFVYAVSCCTLSRTHLELVRVSPIEFHQLVTAFSRRWSAMEFQKYTRRTVVVFIPSSFFFLHFCLISFWKKVERRIFILQRLHTTHTHTPLHALTRTGCIGLAKVLSAGVSCVFHIRVDWPLGFIVFFF